MTTEDVFNNFATCCGEELEELGLEVRDVRADKDPLYYQVGIVKNNELVIIRVPAKGQTATMDNYMQAIRQAWEKVWTFQCHVCRKVYVMESSRVRARQVFKRLHGGEEPPHDAKMLCEDCAAIVEGAAGDHVFRELEGRYLVGTEDGNQGDRKETDPGARQEEV